MNDALLGSLLVVAGYLSGSIPFGLVMAKLLLGVDVREVGSGNIGATNAARAGGKKLGVLVLALDALKAVVPILLTRRWMGTGTQGDLWVMAVAIAAFAGHLFPVWLRFKGGKGVATGFGIFVVLAPWTALAGLATWVGVYLATGISSIGSLAGSLVCVLAGFYLLGPTPISWAGAVVGSLIWWRHRENIRRLLRGEEGSFKK
jgi:acyl phosphate:glycerol-3-phosphate acyltransferase